MLRRLGGHRDRRLVLAERQHDAARMKMQRLLAPLVGQRAIHRLAQDRAAELRAMHPHLVGAPGLRLQLQPAEAIAAAQHAIGRGGRLALRIDHHAPAAILARGLEQRALRCGPQLAPACRRRRPNRSCRPARPGTAAPAWTAPCDAARAPGNPRCRGPAGAPGPAAPAGRSAGRRSTAPGWARPPARHGPAARPACPAPGSGRRDTAGAPGSVRGRAVVWPWSRLLTRPLRHFQRIGKRSDLG